MLNPSPSRADIAARVRAEGLITLADAGKLIPADNRQGYASSAAVMRFIIEGDQMPGSNNAGVVIPAGVAHALRTASSEDLIMVYGTSTSFVPAFEGRLNSGVEQMHLPEDWDGYWKS